MQHLGQNYIILCICVCLRARRDGRGSKGQEIIAGFKFQPAVLPCPLLTQIFKQVAQLKKS